MILRNPNRLGLILGTEVYVRNSLATRVFPEILEMGLSSGAIGIDTASSYGDGRVEKLIGDSIGERENNGLVLTKFTPPEVLMYGEEGAAIDFVRRQLMQSLLNMKRSFLDVYFFHSGSNEQFMQDTLWEFLETQKKFGLIRALGLSIKHDLVKSNDLAQIRESRNFGIEVLQTVLNPLNQHSLDFAIGLARDNGMSVLGRMPLSKGLIPKISLVELEDRIGDDGLVKDSIAMFWKEHAFPVQDLEVAVKIGLALSWCLRHVDAVVLAHSTLRQLELNLRVLQVIQRFGLLN